MTEVDLERLDIPLERDGFLRDLVGHLSGTLQDVIGLEEASGFISVVGQKMGEEIDASYRAALQLERLDRALVSAVLVNLKQRIQGNFSVVSEDDDKIVLRTTSCPFGDKVIDRPSLCMMTSNVFGTISADNLGYAKVSLEETIAAGADGCMITVYLRDNEESAQADGHEYFQG